MAEKPKRTFVDSYDLRDYVVLRMARILDPFWDFPHMNNVDRLVEMLWDTEVAIRPIGQIAEHYKITTDQVNEIRQMFRLPHMKKGRQRVRVAHRKQRGILGKTPRHHGDKIKPDGSPRHA